MNMDKIIEIVSNELADIFQEKYETEQEIRNGVIEMPEYTVEMDRLEAMETAVKRLGNKLVGKDFF